MVSPELEYIYRMGGRRPGESEADLVDRRGREADERARAFDQSVAKRRAAGIPDVPSACAPAFDRPQDRFGFWEYGRG